MSTFAERGFWARLAIAAVLLALTGGPCAADIIWSDLGETLAHESGPGEDILGKAVARDDLASNVLYFKFRVSPISDAGTEPYFAAFALYEGESPRLALGNAPAAWAYGAYNVAELEKTNFNVFETAKSGDPTAEYGIDLNSSKPASGQQYELPRKGIARTIVARVQYVPGGRDMVTVWLDPDLGAGATEAGQSESLTTHFAANASFDQIRLRHGGGGGGWIFSEMAIATAFSDFIVDDAGAGPGLAGRGQLPFTFRQWRREEGLPQNYVRALAQTRDGYLWIGNDAGASRFDGARFVSFGLPEGFHAGPVQAMLGDHLGALWLGSIGRGLGRWQNQYFTVFTRKDGLPSDTVNALAEGADGTIWAGTDAGLIGCKDGKLVAAPSNAELVKKAVTALCADASGAIWMAIKDLGLFVLRDGTVTKVASPFDDLLKNTRCLLLDHEGRLWAGTAGSSVLYRENGQWRHYRFPHTLGLNYISALAEDREGTVWAGSASEGLFRFKHGKLVAVNAGGGLSDNLVESLLVDRDGKLWVGTHEGLNRLRPKALGFVGNNEGLGGAAQSLAELGSNVIWAAKAGEGLSAWDGRYFRPLQVDAFAAEGNRAAALLAMPDGTCWVGGSGGLLHFTNTDAVESEPGIPALTNLDVSALALDNAGRLWAGSRTGELWSQDSNGWVAHTNGPTVGGITALAAAGGGAMWVGTPGEGLFAVDAPGSAAWRKFGGLLSGWVRTLYVDNGGILWVGTSGGGLAELKAGRVSSFTTREGLPDNTVSQILEDDAGNLWAGGELGVFCVAKNELEAVAEQRTRMVYPRVYGRSEGMLSEECLAGCFPTALRSRSGTLWFPTPEGIAVVDPRKRSGESPAPGVVLEETLVDGAPARAGALNLPPGKHWLEFHYTGVNFDAPGQVRFRYRLSGLDADWREGGPSRSASYPYVPHGDYQFEVMAAGADGKWGDSAASIALRVAPHVWQSAWFWVPVGLGLIALILAVARGIEQRKVARQMEHLRHEQMVAQERERIARDLHDDLGSSLARISLLGGLLSADREHPALVENHARKISQSADQTVRALEEIVWAVRPKSDSLQGLIEYIAHFANELFEGSDIRCRLDLPAELPAVPLPPDLRHNIFLVAKEALTNAFKHAKAREVLVQARVEGGVLVLTVRDDGAGFDPRQAGGGNGLGNMARRAEAMGETVKVESSAGAGTTVTLRFHLDNIPRAGQAA